LDLRECLICVAGRPGLVKIVDNLDTLVVELGFVLCRMNPLTKY
jgi:hypothetical protein